MNRHLIRHAAAGVFVLLAGTAVAQQPAQPSANAVALAAEIVVNAGVANSFAGVIDPILEQIRRAGAARPDLRKDLEEVLQMLAPEMELQKRQITNAAARHYAAAMSEAELRDVAAFFKSAAGRKYVEMQPALTEQVVKEMQAWSKEVGEYLMIRTRGEMSKRGHRM